jgi:hypothetical protein
VPLSDGQASFTTPADLDANDYTITATYTGDALNAASTTSTQLVVDPAPTTLAVVPTTTSTPFGVPVTYTATVACSPSCGGLTPTGEVDFTEAGTTTSVEVVNGQATFTTDPTISPGLDNEVDAAYSPFPDAPQDFAATAPAVQSFYDIGAVDLSAQSEDRTTSSSPAAITNGGSVTVNPADENEFSVQMAADVGGGVPPGPLTLDVAEQAASISVTGCTLGASPPSATVTGCSLTGVQVGDVVTDVTTPANIPSSPPTTVVSLDPVTLSTSFSSTITGDSLMFTPPPTDETAALGLTASESAPSADAGDGLTDYFWTIAANALSGIAGTSATVTISSPGSTDFAPATFTFTLDW